jgi:hypothetical protein
MEIGESDCEIRKEIVKGWFFDVVTRGVVKRDSGILDFSSVVNVNGC